MPRPPNPHPYQKTVTRWLLDGKQVKAHTPGAVKQTTKTEVYYADVPGAGTVSLKTADLQLAWKRLNDRLKEQHQRELGIRDEYSSHAKTPILTHLAAWLNVLKAKGTGAKQRDTVERRLTRLFELAKWTRLAQIKLDSALLALARLQEETPPRGRRQGRGAQTRNHYVTHLRAFCSWLVLTDRLPKNPVRELAKVNVETDRRHARRTPTQEEVAELFRHLEGPDAPERMGMSGRQRALGYRVALVTGYRADELRSLGRESFDLERGVVRLLAAEDKRRRGDDHPLPTWLVEELAAWFAADGGCWQGFPANFPGRILKADLAAARAAWIAAAAEPSERQARAASRFLCWAIETPEGRRFWDMHSLRVWYVTELAHQPSMTLKTLMTLARHTTPALSLNVYAKVREESLQAAQNQLRRPGDPELPPAPPG